MKYKTVIEISSEADNKNEAMEIVGEYLSGNLTSGVDMRCRTKPVISYKKPLIGVALASVMLIIGLFSFTHLPSTKNFVGNLTGISAVQPTLKTSEASQKEKFKKEWEKKQMNEALNLIKK